MRFSVIYYTLVWLTGYYNAYSFFLTPVIKLADSCVMIGKLQCDDIPVNSFKCSVFTFGAVLLCPQINGKVTYERFFSL